MTGLGRWLLPALVLALILGLVLFQGARAPGATAATKAVRPRPPQRPVEEAVPPPSGPSPVQIAGGSPATPFELQLEKRLAAAAGQSDAVEALVDAYVGVPLGGVAPGDEDKRRARERGCWMLENAGADDPRRAILECGS